MSTEKELLQNLASRCDENISKTVALSAVQIGALFNSSEDTDTGGASAGYGFVDDFLKSDLSDKACNAKFEKALSAAEIISKRFDSSFDSSDLKLVRSVIDASKYAKTSYHVCAGKMDSADAMEHLIDVKFAVGAASAKVKSDLVIDVAVAMGVDVLAGYFGCPPVSQLPIVKKVLGFCTKPVKKVARAGIDVIYSHGCEYCKKSYRSGKEKVSRACEKLGRCVDKCVSKAKSIFGRVKSVFS